MNVLQLYEQPLLTSALCRNEALNKNKWWTKFHHGSSDGCGYKVLNATFSSKSGQTHFRFQNLWESRWTFKQNMTLYPVGKTFAKSEIVIWKFQLLHSFHWLKVHSWKIVSDHYIYLLGLLHCDWLDTKPWRPEAFHAKKCSMMMVFQGYRQIFRALFNFLEHHKAVVLLHSYRPCFANSNNQNVWALNTSPNLFFRSSSQHRGYCHMKLKYHWTSFWKTDL